MAAHRKLHLYLQHARAAFLLKERQIEANHGFHCCFVCSKLMLAANSDVRSRLGFMVDCGSVTSEMVCK